MATRRSSVFDNVDQGLARAIETVSRGYKPYRAEAFSGRTARPKNPNSLHPSGGAMDVNLFDANGRQLPNIGDPSTATAYQGFANEVMKWAQANDPELAKQLRWGGYFAGGSWPQDWMHFDTGGGDAHMAGGSWEGGFNPETMQKLKLAASGGLGPAAQQQATAAIAAAPPDVQRAFLSTIAGTESPGYDTMYGGGKFNDYSQHPHAKIPIMSGPNKGDYSSAAGRYQFLGSTWDEQAKKYGYADFKPETQDKAAWQYANDVYKQKTGGSLEEALQSGDPGRINAAGSTLSSIWTSLPGGVEQAKGYGTGTFADAFSKNLGVGGPRGPVEAAGGGAGSDTPYKAPPAVATAPAAKPTRLQRFAKGIGEMGAGGIGGGDASPYQMQPQIAAARIDQGDTPTIDPQAQEMQRQQLAMAMQRLNSGRLF